MTGEAHRRSFVEKVRQENEQEFGPRAQRAVQRLLPAGLPYRWTYVYELTQNAVDAGARCVVWRIDGDAVVFQHDGDARLDKRHVRGIASLGASTKGLTAVGFMGVGFKSVFARFRRARISGFGWRFKFDVGTRRGDLDSSVTQWFDTLRPLWDEEGPNPDDGYSTAFRLERPVALPRPVAEDIERLASPDDPTPLAVLALRGLKQVRVGGVIWNLAVDDGVVEVRCSERETVWRWKSFVSRYRPDDDAMRRFLEVRQETQDHVGYDGRRVEREVVGLLPLDNDRLPNPPNHGRVYATLPTPVQVPFRFHVQADWLVDVDRQSLREVDGDPWQEAIVRQVPEIVRKLLLWFRETSEASMKQGYLALRDPSTDDGPLSKPIQKLRADFSQKLADQRVVPIYGAGPRLFRTPKEVARLPSRFLDDFGRRPMWRPEVLFGRDLMDEDLLTTSGTGFALWLGWGRGLEAYPVTWPKTLPDWWEALPEDGRIDALLALWHGVSAQNWDDAPVVPTESGAWIPASRTRWLNEEAPTENNPSGTEIATALERYLPRAEERVAPDIRARVSRTDHAGSQWLQSKHQRVELASLIQRACEEAEDRDHLPLVELLEWALSRGDRRRDLVPLVLTEKGARKPENALLADPLVEGGQSRRELFLDKPALSEDYAIIDEQHAVILFLERLGVCGGGVLDEKRRSVGRHDRGRVAELIGIDEQEVKSANSSGYTVVDYRFPFEVENAPPEALQEWLSREHVGLRDKGRWSARSKWYGEQRTQGTKSATWVCELQRRPWVLCADGRRRRPGEVLLASDPDFEDASIAAIDGSLADRLTAEGVRFGSGVPKSPVLRRLTLRGAAELPDSVLADLLREALEHVEAGEASRRELIHALHNVRLRGVPLMGRVVQRSGAGSGQRSDLGGWVVALADVEPSLASAIRDLGLSISETTTGRQALDFLDDIWKRKPEHVEAIRGNLAAAYRYVVDDIDRGDLPAAAWREALDHAHLYGQGCWRPISRDLVVDDIRSPLIRQFLPEGRSIVAAAHLGDTTDQVGRVAHALGVGLLSADVEVQQGQRADDPPSFARLSLVLDTLALLEDRRELREIEFYDSLSLRVHGTEHPISAYVDDETFMLVGKPRAFAVEAAGQLVEHFRLNQRGSEIPFLTGALYALEDENAFQLNLSVLAEGLGVELPDGSTAYETCDQPPRAEEAERPHFATARSGDSGEPAQDTSKDSGDGGGSESSATADDSDTSSNGEAVAAGKISRQPAGHGNQGGKRGTKETGSSRDRGRTNETVATERPLASGRAADHFKLLLAELGRSEEHESGSTHAGRGGKKDDRKTRQVVIEYEASQQRHAEAMPDNQPGFDVLSVDESTGIRRHIEVKGVQGIFEEDASVVLTARQVHDAVQNVEDGVEYWLYVVDSTETASPRVFPIPWTQYRTRLRYGFYARTWVGAAEQPTDLT